MPNSNYIVATIKPWNIQNFKRRNFGSNWYLITSKDLYSHVKFLKPRYIFFPHWSWMIPAEIYEHYECVIFHMTDLPFGRGAEPLQHLIMRGLKETMVSAIRCVKDIDAGNIYMKRPMSLYGSAEAIYRRCSDICFDMIEMIAYMELKADKPQVGEPVYFTKRTVEDCRLPDVNDLDKVYDAIRCQDAESYQPTFMDTDNLRFEFTNAVLKSDYIEVSTKIKVRDSK
jgi:methionyl-tRNA formyltransferase